MARSLRQLRSSLVQWFDADAAPGQRQSRTMDVVRCIPFYGLQLCCLAVFWVGWSPVAVMVAVGLYFLRMFAITGFYHRYFSHHSFKCGRIVQFVFAVLGCCAVQRGPLWWAAHHRHHHRHSDEAADVHSPHHGFWRSHMMWFIRSENFATAYGRIKDFARFPELRFLNRYDMLVPVGLAAALYGLGAALAQWAPALGTNGMQMLIWGFFVSTTVLYHATFSINSLAHVYGKRPYQTRDDSRNNWFLALITLGEGWHNNHHRFPGSVRQGHVWWEIDFTYYILRAMARLGLVRDLKGVPQRIIGERHLRRAS